MSLDEILLNLTMVYLNRKAHSFVSGYFIEKIHITAMRLIIFLNI